MQNPAWIGATRFVTASGGGGSTVTFDAAGTTVFNLSPTSPFDAAAASLALTVGSGANRALEVIVGFENTVTAVTASWDQDGTPQAMTLITNKISGSLESVFSFGLIAPTSGQKKLRITWIGVGGEIALNAVSWTGVDQTSVAVAFPHAAADAQQSATSSLTITSATGNAVMSASIGGAAFTLNSVNQTQVMLYHGSGSLELGANRAAGASGVSLTGTWAGSENWAIIGNDIKSAP